jgi:PAS domain-containing protein
MFDHTWTLAIVLATALAVVSWYFGLAQLDIEPVVWLSTALALVQMALSSWTQRAISIEQLRSLALTSQLLGTLLMGLSWHVFGGLQQPLFPLFILLPLLPGSLLLGFWQQQLATLALLFALISGLLLSPDTNSFIEQRYGISIGSVQWLPQWIPRSRVAFADVNTSPTYNLMLILGLAVAVVAVSTTARALVNLCRRSSEHLVSIESELSSLQDRSAQLMYAAPSPQVLVMVNSGRIVNASSRFLQAFDIQDAAGRFLLDTVTFTYPSVIKQLIASGGEDIQGATVRGRDLVLRIRVSVIGAGDSRAALLGIEPCDDVCWRGEVDTLDEPVFAVDARGHLAFLNRSAVSLFGAASEGSAATELFESGAARWWEIAPLESARRVLHRGSNRYIASIRRTRIAASIGELSFVHLHQRESDHAVAAS